MVILSATVVPIFHRAKVYTAYEYLEHRFDAKTRLLVTIVFLISRFVMVWLMGFVRPAKLLALMAVGGTALCAYAALAPGMSGIWAVVMVSACLSLMFPTIYGIALHGLREDTK